MKKFISITVILLALMTLLGGNLQVFAAAYKTYTYSVNGQMMNSPDAYTPERQVNAAYMGLSASSDANLYDPADLVIDDDMNVYIVDRGSNRVVVLDKNYKFKLEFGKAFVNDQGVDDSLNQPSGMFVKNDDVYVCDTENNRVVVFNRAGQYLRTVLEPSSDVFEEDAIYKPVAIAVDDIGNLYVVSSTTYQGVIVLNSEGVFQSYLGAQKVAVNPLDLVRRQFQTKEQRAQSKQYVSTEYNNITIDSEGFVYVTTSSIDEAQQQAAIQSKSSDFAPVKKLNSSGSDIMMRSGFFGPGGEVNVATANATNAAMSGPSKIIDVALGPEGTWSIIDEKRSKVYTYDQYGRLLHIFGDTGSMLGNIDKIEAIVYQGDKILLLDKTSLNINITVYDRTEYGDIIINALHNNNERNYDKAVSDWNAILQRNGNFDTAYVGIGKAYYRAGDWQKAMQYFKYAYDANDYSLAFKNYRKEWISSSYGLLIPVVVIGFVFGLVKLFSWGAKVNKAAIHKQGRKSRFREEVLYAFHIFGHPFDGFWDLKHEKRGSVRGAIFWVAMAIIAFTYQALGQSYLFNPTGAKSSAFMQAISILVPLFLLVTSNWCLSTFFDGEATFKDLFVAISYSLAPLPFLVIPAVLLTHVLSLNEASLVSLLVEFAWVWVGILAFFGLMTTNNYSLFVNVLNIILTIVGMVFIMFVALLFTGLISKIVGFISSIVTELSYRM
ncbi:MAG: YIP1 family protein [Clostridia bacterium]|nr:YIP1 family protein [Clostridia bacterium]